MIETGAVIRIKDTHENSNIAGRVLPVVSGGSAMVIVTYQNLRWAIPISDIAEVYAPFHELIYSEFVASRLKPMERPVDNILHCVLGCGTEAGELMSTAKKLWAYEKPMGAAERENLIEEAGDLLFYLVGLCNSLGITMSQIAEENRRKLVKRYPNGYSNSDAVARADKGGVDAGN